MYKLHGLGVEYKCEVCGNQSYWGRRAFDRHFQEWRHAHGKHLTHSPTHLPNIVPLTHTRPTTTYTSLYSYINQLHIHTGMRCLGVPNTKHFHDITLIGTMTVYSVYIYYVYTLCLYIHYLHYTLYIYIDHYIILLHTMPISITALYFTHYISDLTYT